MSEYLLYQPGGKPFLAFMKGSSPKVLALFPATTWKKKSVLYYLRVAAFLKLRIPPIVYHENISIFATSISDISRSLKSQGQYCNQPQLIMWNREYKRNRAYLWLGNERNCQDVAFAKIGRKDTNEMDFRREYDTLKALSDQEITFKFPRPLLLFNDNQTSILLTSSLPSKNTQFEFLPWAEIDAHLTPVTTATRNQITYPQLEMLGWFRLFQARIDNKSLETIKMYLQGNPINVGFIHGDIGSENTFLINEQLWIIDWEKSSLEGPIATDRLGHWLGKKARITGLNKKILHSFFDTFRNSLYYSSGDILLALCYLTLMDFPPAAFIFQHLKQDNFSAWI